MKPNPSTQQTVPLGMVGSTKFGRYPKISVEQTVNMIMSDGFLVPFAGDKVFAQLNPHGVGRGFYGSNRFQHMIAVIGRKVYAVDKGGGAAQVGELMTEHGNVFMDENDNNQINITDLENMYNFNYSTGAFTQVDFIEDARPGYVTFQDGYFIAPDLNSSAWYLSAPNDGTTWSPTAQTTGEFQTRADTPIAIVPFPGRGGTIIIMGSVISEDWQDNPSLNLFPYQRSTYNINYGCVSPDTIAANENIVVWLGINRTSGLAILMTDGSEPIQLSNDGINFKLADLDAPQNSHGFLYKQDGHLIYQLTFTTDNLTYIYDFETQRFFTLTDHDNNYHPAKKVIYFNDRYYFISLNDGNIYQLSSTFTTYHGETIPRARVTSTYRQPDGSRFVINNLGYIVEQGESNSLQRIDLALSKDGGQTFLNVEGKELNTSGNRVNRFQFWRMGSANEFCTRHDFWGKGRFVIGEGTMRIYQ